MFTGSFQVSINDVSPSLTIPKFTGCDGRSSKHNFYTPL